MFTRRALATILLLATSAAETKLPSFDQFPVAENYTGPVVQPKFLTGDPDKLPFPDGELRCIGSNAKERESRFQDAEPNFAGHYVMEACTCGTGCHYLFLWDARNGAIIRNFPFGSIDVGPYWSGQHSIEYAGEDYRRNSRLLVVEDCFDQDSHPKLRDCAKYLYVFNAGRFVLLRKVATRVPPLSKQR